MTIHVFSFQNVKRKIFSNPHSSLTNQRIISIDRPRCVSRFPFAYQNAKLARSTSVRFPTCYANDSCAGTNLSTRLLLPLQMLAAAYLCRGPPSPGPYSDPYHHFSAPSLSLFPSLSTSLLIIHYLSKRII